MKEQLEKALWERAKSTYPGGTSKHTNALLEEDFNDFIEQVVKLCTIHHVVDMLPTCSNCKKEMKLHGVAYECSCGIVKVVK